MCNMWGPVPRAARLSPAAGVRPFARPRARRAARDTPVAGDRDWYLVPLHVGWVGNDKPVRKASYTII